MELRNSINSFSEKIEANSPAHWGSVEAEISLKTEVGERLFFLSVSGGRRTGARELGKSGSRP